MEVGPAHGLAAYSANKKTATPGFGVAAFIIKGYD